MPEIM